jgi:hypothetical protein
MRILRPSQSNSASATVMSSERRIRAASWRCPATPLGQMILVLLLGAYVATLVWMRRMAAGKPLPRFIRIVAGGYRRGSPWHT